MRSNRLLALATALYELQPDNSTLNLTDDERTNILGNLLTMTLEEARALVRVFGEG